MQLKPIAPCWKCALRSAALLIIYKPSDLKGGAGISNFCGFGFWTLSETSQLSACLCVSTNRLLWNTLLMFLGDTCAVTDPVTGETRAFTHNVGEVTLKQMNKKHSVPYSSVAFNFWAFIYIIPIALKWNTVFCGTLADQVILLMIASYYAFFSSCNNTLDCFTQNNNGTIIHIVTCKKKCSHATDWYQEPPSTFVWFTFMYISDLNSHRACPEPGKYLHDLYCNCHVLALNFFILYYLITHRKPQWSGVRVQFAPDMFKYIR